MNEEWKETLEHVDSYHALPRYKLIKFKSEEAKTPAFELANKLLHEECRSIQETIEALKKIGCSELYAKSVVVHIKTALYMR